MLQVQQPRGRLRRRDAGAARRQPRACRRAGSSPCWAPTAPARPRCCAPCRGLLDVHDGEVTKGSVTLDDAADPPASRRRRSCAAASAQVMEGRRIFAELTRRGEPAARRRTPTRGRSRERLERVFGLFPVLAERRRRHGRLPVRRRAADARDGPGADGRAALPAARRAEPRARAAAGRADPRPDRARSTAGHRGAAGRAERDDGAVDRLATATSWRPARSCWTSRPRELLADEDIREFYLGLRAGGRRRSRSATSSTTSGGSGGCHEHDERRRAMAR